jgi:transposase
VVCFPLSILPRLCGFLSAISLGIHRETVGIYKLVDQVPIRGGNKPYTAAPYESSILQKWNQGYHSTKQVFREIKELGYTGSISSVYRYLFHLGMQPGVKQQEQLQPRRLTARQAAWLLTLPEEKLDSYQKRYRFALCEKYPGIREVSEIANGFIKILQEQETTQLVEWIQKAQKCSIAKIRYFAKGVENDFSAVQAAVSFDWSNGQLEGQVNRLKTIKRMMYGRAKLDLLRKRILCY